jgi:hypothetical protein
MSTSQSSTGGGTFIVSCEQGDDTWFQARAGVVTASNFRIARQRMRDNTRELTETAAKYAFHLAGERATGFLSEDRTFETWAMKRGTRLEPMARARHMADIGVRVRPVGMVLTEDRAFGASADGWIGADGGAEYKCLVGAGSMREVFLNEDISFYMDQVQGNLWLSNREFWDFCVYCPQFESIGADWYRQRVVRNESYIEQMIWELNDFNNVVNQYTDRLIEFGRKRGFVPGVKQAAEMDIPL